MAESGDRQWWLNNLKGRDLATVFGKWIEAEMDGAKIYVLAMLPEYVW